MFPNQLVIQTLFTFLSSSITTAFVHFLNKILLLYGRILFHIRVAKSVFPQLATGDSRIVKRLYYYTEHGM